MVMYYVTRDEEENQDQLMVILSGQVRCIDGSAPDYERILDGLHANPEMSVESAISLIDGEQNAIESMSDGAFSFRRGHLYDVEGRAVPDSVSEQCRLRMENGTDSYESLMKFYQRLMTLPNEIRERFIETAVNAFVLDNEGNLLVRLRNSLDIDRPGVTVDRESVIDLLDDEEVDLDEVFIPGARLESEQGFPLANQAGDVSISVAPESLRLDYMGVVCTSAGVILEEQAVEGMSFENPYESAQDSNELHGEFHGSFDDDDC